LRTLARRAFTTKYTDHTKKPEISGQTLLLRTSVFERVKQSAAKREIEHALLAELGPDRLVGRHISIICEGMEM
jgi:hypothetical protein